jgi:putative transposase
MKKHSLEEIAAKLRRAQEMVERGLPQAEICSALGVSVMTFYRWRKLSLQKGDGEASLVPAASIAPHADVPLADVPHVNLSHAEVLPRVEDLPDVQVQHVDASRRHHVNEHKRLQNLELENQQLRKLVTDLMLEKMHLQEAVNSAAEKVG